MKRSMEVNLTDAGVIFEGFVQQLDKLPEADLIDLAARIKPVAKACKTVDEYVKDKVKKKRNGKEGTVLGNMFKAILKLIPSSRFNQGAFKEAEPTRYNKYVEDVEDERVTFELR